jgi:hypothetical protein
LLTAHTQGPIGREVMDQSIPEINEREIVRETTARAPREVVADRAPVKEPALVVERVAVREPVATAANTSKPDKPRETRAYKGAIYEKGDDGQWHRL